MVDLFELSKDIYKQQVAELDKRLFEFLAEQGISDSKTINGIRADMKDKGMDLIIDQERLPNEDLKYTLTITRLVAKKTLLVKFPKLEL